MQLYIVTAAETGILLAFRAFCFLAISYRFGFCFNCMLTSWSFICTSHSINIIITDNNNIIMGLKSSEEQAITTVDERSSILSPNALLACDYEW